MTKIYLPVTPTPEDLERARQLPDTACPRRYCWFWHSLSFDWDTPEPQGCTLTNCRRATGNQHHVDYYEPREPHILEDQSCGSR